MSSERPTFARVVPWLALGLALALPAPALADASREALERRVAELEAENAELRRRLGIAEEELVDLRVERDRLGTLAALPPKETPAARLTGEYDPETRRTFVDSAPLVIPETLRGLDVPHRLGVRFDFAGEEIHEPIQEASIVISTQANTNGRYAGLDAVTLRADGEGIELPVADYRVTRRTRSGPTAGHVRIDEEIRVVADRAALRRLALAQELELAVGRRDLALSRDHQALLVAVYERMRASGE